MNKYILIDNNDVVQGFFPSVEEAKQYARKLDLQDIAIYELVDNSYNLAEQEGKMGKFVPVTCPKCRGKKVVVVDCGLSFKCPMCFGQGVVVEEE